MYEPPATISRLSLEPLADRLVDAIEGVARRLNLCRSFQLSAQPAATVGNACRKSRTHQHLRKQSTPSSTYGGNAWRVRERHFDIFLLPLHTKPQQCWLVSQGEKDLRLLLTKAFL